MVYFGTIGQLYKTTSFLVVSTSFHSEMRKSIGNKEETTSLFFFITITKLKHATRVTTLWLKQPICFYSVIFHEHLGVRLLCSIQGIFLSQIKHTKDWRCDQYRWDNQGVARLPRKNPKVRKLYFNADTPTGSTKEFQRHAYQLLDDKSLTLVHYIGDEGAAKDFSHRGAIQQPDKPFVRTCPSYLKACEEMCKNEKANVVYKRWLL